VYAVRSDDAALDIVQDAMIRLAEKYADRPAAELPLLFQRILSNATMDWFRRQKVRNARSCRTCRTSRGATMATDFDLLENSCTRSKTPGHRKRCATRFPGHRSCLPSTPKWPSCRAVNGKPSCCVTGKSLTWPKPQRHGLL
jgi:hypothetical protein